MRVVLALLLLCLVPSAWAMMPTLADEQTLYRRWGWSMPAVPTVPGLTMVRDANIHGDTEGDDLWTYLMQYQRTGQQGYLQRAQAWARYMRDDYRQCTGTQSYTYCYDRDNYQLDHLYGRGLLAWSQYAGDASYLVAAEALAGDVEAYWATYPYQGFGGATRQMGRHLHFIVDLARVTNNARWITLREKLIAKVLTTYEWLEDIGMYADQATVDEKNGTGAWTAGVRGPASTFQVPIFVEALQAAYEATGNAELKRRIIKMAQFTRQYALDPTYQQTCSFFGVNITTHEQVCNYTYHQNPVTFFDPLYTVSLINVLVLGYQHTGDTTFLDRAKLHYAQGQHWTLSPTTHLPVRRSAENTLDHFADTTFDTSSGSLYLAENKGELQYVWRLFDQTLPWAAPIPPQPPPSSCSTLNVGEWCAVPNSKLRALDPCPARNCPYSGVEGIAAVLDDWAGGAWDSDQHCLLVTGGGHSGYGGNEVYRFCLSTLRWERLTEPSTAVDMSKCGENPDRTPSSRHNYAGLVYLPAPQRQLWLYGGDAAYLPGGCSGLPNVWTLDLATKVWTVRTPPSSGSNTPPNGGKGVYAVWDAATNSVWVHGTETFDGAHVSRWALSNNAWQQRSAPYGQYNYGRMAGIDPVHHLLVAVGNAASDDIGAGLDVFALNTPGTIPRQTPTTTGEKTLEAAYAPGFVWDATGQRFVGWHGGAALYALHPTTWVWTKLAPAATNTVVPTSPNKQGTFGRFQCDASLGLCVVVNAVDENVYVYRLAPAAAPDGTVHVTITPRKQ